MSAILYPTKFRDWELTSGTGADKVTIKGRRTHAAGVTSATIGGVESQIANDHGRGLQESCSLDRDIFGSPTAWNPTGHGSQDDSTGSTSESVPLGVWLSPDGTKVRTRVQAAYWLGPGDVGAAPAADTTPSPAIFDKTITASYGGQAGLFRVDLSLVIPTKANIQAMGLLVTEALCLYFNTAGPASMSVAEDWDYATEALSAIPAGEMLPAGPTFRSARPVISNAGGTMCGAIYSVTKSSGPLPAGAVDGNSVLSRAGDHRVTDHNSAGATIMNPDVQIAWDFAAGIPAATYVYEVYFALGTKANVLSLLTWLKTNVPSP